MADMSSTAATAATPFVCGFFAIQSLTSPTAATPRALDLFSVNNSVSNNPSVWTIYAETHQITSTGNSYVAEFEARNIKGSYALKWNPYQLQSGAIGLELGCGAGLSATGQFNCNVAQYVAANPMPWNAGLSFVNGSVAAIGGFSPAIQMPTSYDIEWWSNSSTRQVYITADNSGNLSIVPTAGGTAHVVGGNFALDDGQKVAWGSTTTQSYILGSTASQIITFNTNGAEVARVVAGAFDIGTTSGPIGYKLNVSGITNSTNYYANGTAGVTCSGTPTASFAATAGIVTHC